MGRLFTINSLKIDPDNARTKQEMQSTTDRGGAQGTGLTAQLTFCPSSLPSWQISCNCLED